MAFWGIARRWGPRGGAQPTPQHPPPIPEALLMVKQQADEWARKGPEIGGTVHFFIGMYSLGCCVQVVPTYKEQDPGLRLV